MAGPDQWHLAVGISVDMVGLKRLLHSLRSGLWLLLNGLLATHRPVIRVYTIRRSGVGWLRVLG